MDMRWRHPWTSIIAGPTGCGKTEFVKKFLKYRDRMATESFDRILFYYAEWQEGYRTENFLNDGQKIEWRQGLPQTEHYSNDPQLKKLIIIDDLMRESSNNTTIDLFTKGSHHKNISVIFITQNIFHKGHGQRDVSLNTNYIVLFKNPRDRAQIQHLARQVYPEDTKFLQEAYQDAVSKPYGYLLLDLTQTTSDEFRFRTCIFPDDEHHFIYLPKYQTSKHMYMI